MHIWISELPASPVLQPSAPPPQLLEKGRFQPTFRSFKGQKKALLVDWAKQTEDFVMQRLQA
jgi:hypothetical protein